MRRFAKSDKVADLLRHAISNAFLMEMDDQNLRGITLTDIDLNRDLTVAKIYYSVTEEKLTLDGAKEALKECTRDLRRYLGKNLRLKQVPELRWTYDETLASARNIEALIDQIHKDGDGNPS